MTLHNQLTPGGNSIAVSLPRRPSLNRIGGVADAVVRQMHERGMLACPGRQLERLPRSLTAWAARRHFGYLVSELDAYRVKGGHVSNTLQSFRKSPVFKSGTELMLQKLLGEGLL